MSEAFAECREVANVRGPVKLVCHHNIGYPWTIDHDVWFVTGPITELQRLGLWEDCFIPRGRKRSASGLDGDHHWGVRLRAAGHVRLVLSIPPPEKQRLCEIALARALEAERGEVVRFLLEHDPSRPERAFQHPHAASA